MSEVTINEVNCPECGGVVEATELANTTYSVRLVRVNDDLRVEYGKTKEIDPHSTTFWCDNPECDWSGDRMDVKELAREQMEEQSDE